MERDPDDITPERPSLNGADREALRARIRNLLESHALADQVRARLTARLPLTDEPFEVGEEGLDGMLEGLPLSIRRFLRGPEGSLGSFIGHPRPSKEDHACSKT
jgi:hypothetical protein